MSGRPVELVLRQRTYRGWLAEPDSPPPPPPAVGARPGVVVIHEAFGLTDDIRGVTERIAAEGYAALAIDLFSGQQRAICMARLFGGALLRPLTNGTLGTLRDTLGWLAAQPGVDASRIGAVGFCLGGSFAIAWACTDERLKVVAPFYALNPRPLDAVARACPVVGSYPGADFTAGQGRKLDAALERHGIAHDVKVYAGARHSFFNDRGATHDPVASADAWRRLVSFFGERLGAP